jgi:hypothetical protein
VSAEPRSNDDVRPSLFADAYWVDGVALAAGEYPGSLRADTARQKIGALLDAGVRRFVDLTSRHDRLDPYLPLLNAEAAARGVRVAYQRLDVPDMGIPSVERMTEILDELDAAVGAKEPVYVHCWGGVGRTGTVIGCWLVRHGHSPDEALAEVARLFATMSEGKRRRHPEGSPQTAEQRQFVRQWAAVERAAKKP